MASNRLNISVGIHQPQSRAGLITSATLPEASEIGIKLEGYDDADNIKFTAATQDSKQVWNPASDIVLDETKGTLYAYYPWKSGTNLSAIPVETASQTDYLYAEPVANVSEKNPNVALTMKHMLAYVKIAINKGTYVGTGNISKITVQSDGFATAGTFNAAQETPAYTATTGAGTAIESNAATTLGGTATDIMVVPTGVAKPITFTATIDDVDYTVASSDVTLKNGNSYEYTLSLNSTFMSVAKVAVTEWNIIPENGLDLNKAITWTTAPNGVYAVSAEGKPVAVTKADASCIGVALVAGEHKFMIAKSDATDGTNTTFYWGMKLFGKDVTGVVTNDKVDGTNHNGYLPKPDGTFDGSIHLSDDFTTWTAGALAEFDGKANTAAIIAGYTEHGVSMDARDMCTVLNTFNTSDSFKDWYVPALGQLALMYLNMTEINAALAKIGGTALAAKCYWSSSERDSGYAWYVFFGNGGVSNTYKSVSSGGIQVRFVRDI